MILSTLSRTNTNIFKSLFNRGVVHLRSSTPKWWCDILYYKIDLFFLFTISLKF